MNILLTGSSGFIGGALVPALQMIGQVRCSVRSGKKENVVKSSDFYIIDDIGSDTDWGNAIAGVDVVVHAAARAHIKRDAVVADYLAEFRKINRDGTLNLARQAIEAGVKRFVFISSIGVNGGQTRVPFTADDVPAPIDAYALSKWEAEQELSKLAETSGLELVVIRPPLVYGRNAPGNFHTLVSVVRKGIPLPLGAVPNRRTLIAIDNLVDLIVCCVKHPAAANQVFLAGDAQDLSTTELLCRIGVAMGRPARLLPVPVSLMEFGAALLGKRSALSKVCGNLQIDISKAHDLLSWTPPISVDEGLRRCFAENEFFTKKE